MKKLTLLTILIFSSMFIHAQYILTGKVFDAKTGNALAGAQILLMTNGNMSSFAVADSTGMYKIKNVVNGTYDINVSCLGFKEHNSKIKMDDDKTLDIEMIEDEHLLDSVTVTGERLRKTTAFGHIYFLSDKAKKSGDPYKALQEIPEITSNFITQTVESKDKENILVLIDGMLVNTGITPIDPKRIESVEIMDVVSPKYIKTGAKKILNIRLKQQKERYLFSQTGFTNYYPLQNTNVWNSSEYGNSKLSVYYYISASSTKDNISSSSDCITTSAYKKTSATNENMSEKTLQYSAMLKYMPSVKDHLAFYIQGYNGSQKNSNYSWGTFETPLDNESDDNFYADRNLKNLYRTFTNTLFYHHSFNNKSEIDNYISGSYNYNGRRDNTNENYSKNKWEKSSELNTERTSFYWLSDFTWSINQHFGLNISNSLTHTTDRLEEKFNSIPVYKHHEWNENLTPGVSFVLGKFRSSFSLGIECVWRSSANIFDRYLRPSINAALNYQINNWNSIGIYYSANNTAPSVEKLNPYNTSTDSLYRNSGNPHLKPQNEQSAQLTYSFYKKGWYINLSSTFTKMKDMFEYVGYTNNEGIYIKTYGNVSRYKNLTFKLSLCYSFNNTQLMFFAGHRTDYFPEQKHHNSYALYFQAIQTINEKWGINASIGYADRKYGTTFCNRSLRPTGDLQVSYSFHPNWLLQIGASSIFGNPKSEQKTYDKGYTSYSTFKSRDFRPYISIRWTIRKNEKKKINIDNDVMRDREKRIKL